MKIAMSNHAEHTVFDGWAGRIDLRNKQPTAIAEPHVIARDHCSAAILGAGAITQASCLKLGTEVLAEARDPVNRIVYIVLMSRAGRLGGLRTLQGMIREARRHAAIVAYLQEYAFGPAILIGNWCDMVFCHPTTQLGWLGVQTEDGERDDARTALLIEEIAAARPIVSPAAYARLADSSIVAEQAEANSMVNALRRSFDDLVKV